MKPSSHVLAGSALPLRDAIRVILCFGFILILQGCAEKKLRARPWQTALSIRPTIPTPAPGYTPESAVSYAPDLHWDLPAPPPALTVVRQPARPRVATQPAPEPVDSNNKPLAPSLEPQLSPQEIAAAQLQINESMSIAERRLNAAKGRSLNAVQADLVSKVNAFLQESRQAAREGEWMRAKNLARKAQVLSDELAASL